MDHGKNREKQKHVN